MLLGTLFRTPFLLKTAAAAGMPRGLVSASTPGSIFWRKKPEEEQRATSRQSKEEAEGEEFEERGGPSSEESPGEFYDVSGEAPEMVELDQEYIDSFPKPEVAPPMFAVVVMGSKQYKVSPGDRIMIDRIQGPDIGEHIALKKVLLVGTPEYTAIGRPLLGACRIQAEVEEHIRTEKLIVFKKKKRKNYRRRRGVRTPATVIRITDLSFEPSSESAPTLMAYHQHAPLDQALVDYDREENDRVLQARKKAQQIKLERKQKKRGYL